MLAVPNIKNAHKKQGIEGLYYECSRIEEKIFFATEISENAENIDIIDTDTHRWTQLRKIYIAVSISENQCLKIFTHAEAQRRC